MSNNDEILYVLYVYADYRKEVEIEMLGVFSSKEKAIQQAEIEINKNITDLEDNALEEETTLDEIMNRKPEYVCARGGIYDKPGIYLDFFGARFVVVPVPLNPT